MEEEEEAFCDSYKKMDSAIVLEEEAFCDSYKKMDSAIVLEEEACFDSYKDGQSYRIGGGSLL